MNCRHSRKRGFWSPLTVSFVGGGAVVAFALVTVLAVKVVGRSGGVAERESRASGVPLPQPAEEGERWDCHDLLKYLRSRGVNVQSGEGSWGPVRGVIGAELTPDDLREGMATDMTMQSASGGRVVCLRIGTSGASEYTSGSSFLVWGAFVCEAVPVSGSTAILREMAKVLPGAVIR